MAFFTAVFAASVTDGVALASGLDCWSAAFWHPASTAPMEKAESESRARRRFIKFLHELGMFIL